MLIVHPSSTCDVCLEPFSWVNASSTPHAIPCGHIFCLECLRSTHPSNCPLCRKAYIPERIKRLRVDPCTDEIEDDNPVLQVNRHLRRLALVSGDGVPELLATDAISEVNAWLVTHGPSEAVYRPLRNAVAASQRSIALRREAVASREAMEKQGEDLWKQIRLRDLDLQTARTIEENLLDRLQRTEEEFKEKLDHAEKSRAEMEVEFVRMRAEHAQFREELAKHRANPLVHSPQQATRDRPVTSMSRRSSHSQAPHPAYTTSARNGIAYLHTGSSRPIDPSPHISTVLEEVNSAARVRKVTRPSVVIPGAPEYRKIIPPMPTPYRVRDVTSPTSAVVEARPSMPAPPSSSRPPMHATDSVVYADAQQTTHRHAPGPQTTPYEQDTPRAFVAPATIPDHLHSPQYGYVPGVGYVSRSPPPVARSPVEERENVQDESSDTPVAGLLLFSQGPQPVDITTGRTVEAAARNLRIQSGEIETQQSTWGHVYNALVLRSNPSSLSLASTAADSAIQPNVSAAISPPTNLNGLGTLWPPGRTSESPLPAIPRRSTTSPEPSAASSWGTVPSARSSRASILEDLSLMSLPGTIANTETASRHSASRHSSISDLRLARLPDSVTDTVDDNSGSDRGTPRQHSDRPIRPWPGAELPQGLSQSSDDAHALASRVSRVHGPGDLSRAPEPALTPAGLGLALTSSGASAQQVYGQDDLQHVNRSLMQLVAEARNRRSRPVSVASTDSFAEFRSESWEVRAQYVDAARGSDDRPVAHRPVEPPSSASSSGARADREPGPLQREDSLPSRASATENVLRRRHSNATVAPPPPMASSMSFHSERHAPPPSTGDPAPRPPSLHRSQDFGTFGQPGSVALNSDSLLLSMSPPGPNTSAATTSTGEPSSIRAPRPISGRNANIFALWSSRNAH